MRSFNPLARRLFPALLVAAAACGDAGTGPAGVTRLAIVAPSDVLVRGRTVGFGVRGYTAGGDTASVEGVRWSTSDGSVAEVSGDGRVTGVSEGAAEIGASADGVAETRLAVRVAPDTIPLFTSPPFHGTYTVWNGFDHDLPRWSGNAGMILLWTGRNVAGLEGHDGYDWPMPVGTPLLSVANGTVLSAGSETPWPCPLLGNQLVSALYVVVLATAPGGERFLVQYIHLSRIDVATGQTVAAGQSVGLSGNTGCTTGPHLHFEVGRELYQRIPRPGYVQVTDPNGWAGAPDDPWVLDGDGAASSWLWARGASPPFPIAASPSSEAVRGAMDMSRPRDALPGGTGALPGAGR